MRFSYNRRDDNMTIDLHYQSANIVKYRTDVTFGWLDLMVAFGGIAGLFLGCSLLSGVEIVYYILIVALISFKKCKKKFDRVIEVNSKEYRTQRVAQRDKSRLNNSVKKSSDKVQVQTIKVISISDVDKNMKERF